MRIRNQPTHVLILGDDPGAVALMHQALARPGRSQVAVTWLRSLAEGSRRLAEGGVDAILLDLRISNGNVVGALDEVVKAACRVPIVVLTSQGGEEEGRLVLAGGANDWLPREHLNCEWFGLAMRDAIERATMEDAPRDDGEHAQVTLDSMSEGIISVDTDGRVTYVNAFAEEMTGWTRGEAVGEMLSVVFRLIELDTPAPTWHPVRPGLRYSGSGPRCLEVLVRRDGHESFIEVSRSSIRYGEGKATGAVVVFRDASGAQARERELSHLAYYDFLTDLPNRMLLNDRIEQAIALARRSDGRVAVLFLDLDRFKQVNDSLGHAIGDALLQSVSKRLMQVVRTSDTVSRLGGDEFVVLLPRVDCAWDAVRHGEKILQTLSIPHMISNHELRVTGSIGIGVFPDNADNAEALIRCADTAMYVAKASGRNACRLFSTALRPKVERQPADAYLRSTPAREFATSHSLLLALNDPVDAEDGPGVQGIYKR